MVIMVFKSISLFYKFFSCCLFSTQFNSEYSTILYCTGIVPHMDNRFVTTGTVRYGTVMEYSTNLPMGANQKHSPPPL